MSSVFREITEAEFKSFTQESPTKNFMQTPEMYHRYKDNKRECYLLGLFENDSLIVAALVNAFYQKLGQKLFTMSRGPIMDFSLGTEKLVKFLEGAKQFLKEKSGATLQISPSLLVPDAPMDFKNTLKKAGFKYLGEFEQVKWIYTINFEDIENLPVIKPSKKRSYKPLETKLDPEAENTIFRTLHKNHRYTVKYATSRFDLKLRELDIDEYDILYDLVKEAGEVHGFVPRNVDYFKEMKREFGDKVTAIVATLPDGTPIATGFFILYGDEVIYLSSGLRREYKKLGGPHFIQWLMIRYAYQNGFKKYNFWGTHPDPNDGVFKFKQGFNGKSEEFVGTFIAPLSLLGRAYMAKLKPAEMRDLQ